MKEADAKRRLEEVEKLLKLNPKRKAERNNEFAIRNQQFDKQQLINIIAKLKKNEIRSIFYKYAGVDEMSTRSQCGTDKPYFRFVITKKYLLNLAKLRNFSYADTTYKCIWQGFPVFKVGTTDLNKLCHTFGQAVCANKKQGICTSCLIE